MHTPRRTLSKKAQLLSLTALIALTTTIFGCRESNSAEAAPVAAVATVSSQAQAIDAVMALPEVKAASADIEKLSAGKRHGAVMDTGAGSTEVNGKRYWSLSFIENGDEMVHRRASFMVPEQGGEMLIEDSASGQNIPLSDWRKAKGQL